MTNVFKKFIVLTAALFFTVSAFSSETVKVIMPYKPGGGVDQTFLHFQKWLLAKDVRLVGDYKPGAEGLISINELSTSPIDGSVITISTLGTIANANIIKKTATTEPITLIRGSIMAIIAPDDGPYKTLAEVETAIMTGQKISLAYGAPGQKMVLDQMLRGFKSTHTPILVPFKGASPVLTNLLGDHIDVGVVPLNVVKPLVDSNKIKIIALATNQKNNFYPNAMLITSRFPAWQNYDGFVLALPLGATADAIKKWNSLSKEYLSDPAVIKDFQDNFLVPLPWGHEPVDKAIARVEEELNRIEIVK